MMIPPSGREHYSVHSWKAGPDCGKLNLILNKKKDGSVVEFATGRDRPVPLDLILQSFEISFVHTIHYSEV